MGFWEQNFHNQIFLIERKNLIPMTLLIKDHADNASFLVRPLDLKQTLIKKGFF